ncbi:MAG: NAD(P)-dependent oxidoreductase [Spirochaetaceae bacterium]|nr:MAG: NAD(P)-dependent oxidoreductase [Spirochaetaceae bacterium]
MRIALFGGTRGVGRQVLERAVEQGFGVKALARSPQSIPETAGVEVVEGNVLDAGAVFRTVTGCDLVVITLGNTKGNPGTVVSSGTDIILQVMRKLGLSRVIAVSSLGVGDSKDCVPSFFKLLMKTVLKKTMSDKERQEELLRASAADWTIIRPGGLFDGERSGTARTGTGLDVVASKVSRADVAELVLQEVENPVYLKQTVWIT